MAVTIFVAWRDAARLDAVLSSQRTQPTVGELIAEIEAERPITWPS